MMDERRRCPWCGTDPEYVAYHDSEWGVPVRDDRALFEKLCLEGFQSGLSWLTILRKRENFRRAFEGFVVDKVARFTAKDVERLLGDAGIVRHRGKIESVINNAKRARELCDEHGPLNEYIWRYQPEPRAPAAWEELKTITTCAEAVALSKDLKKRGWSFVGPTTVYAFMQAMGLVNDHVAECWVRDYRK